jgi:DNA modification methylase
MIQRQLFADPPAPPLQELPAVTSGARRRGHVAALLQGDLDFHTAASDHASHALHAFAAKFPPQLPHLFVHGLTQPGEVVLDPMMGSGTAVVEAFLGGRLGLGLDIDPLALRLTRVKTTPLNLDETRRLANHALRRAMSLLADAAALDETLSAFDAATRAFVDYWFLPATQRELLALARALGEIAEESQRRFLELVFSAIIVVKSGGVSRARDLAHTRPHLDPHKVIKPALDEFAKRLARSLKGMGALQSGGGAAYALHADARAVPLRGETVDLVMTSPPYANAIDYMRAHKFSLVWFGQAIETLSELRAQYIGSERMGGLHLAAMPPCTAGIIAQLAASDTKKARVLHKYYMDMAAALLEMYRVLKHDRAAILVVGNSTMRGLNVRTQDCLAELGVAAGFELVGIATRQLDRNRRMMPARQGGQAGSLIEQRMHEEYVIGFYKE